MTKKPDNAISLAFKKAVESKTTSKKETVRNRITKEAPVVGKINLDQIQAAVDAQTKKRKSEMKNLSDKK